MAFFALPASASAASTTDSFDFTGGAQLWIVPDGVTEATFDLLGAQGAGSNFGPSGLGGFAAVTIAVVPGQTFQINVGGAGSGSTGGFNGGANGRASGASSSGGGGGGASDVRTGSFGLDDRIVVAGGGGGGGNSRSFNPYRESFGGAGGGARGGDGGGVGNFPEPGTGGTQTAGGSCRGFDCGGTFGAGGAGAGGGVSNGGGGGG
ncbi:MAG: hypothetical protein F2915_03455, partial [Actinobacteria bacterium]|nr:hypothetical protein [Actinomycetota bacterium]